MFCFFQVLNVWRNKYGRGLTVEDFIRHITRWQTSGYLSTGVWGTLQKYVSPDLLQAEVPPPAPSVNSSESTTTVTSGSIPKLDQEGELIMSLLVSGGSRIRLPPGGGGHQHTILPNFPE